MMLGGITRGASPGIVDCTLTYIPRKEIDVTLAARQQREYELCLSELGVRLISLREEELLPDAVFVQDTMVVVDEVAVRAKMGARARQPEVESVARAISAYREVKSLSGPASVEGGDIVRKGRDLYVGLSGRTNRDGIEQLGSILLPYHYRVKPVVVKGCLHLSTACTYLGNNTMLVNREWIDGSQFEDMDLIDVAPGESWAANAVVIGDVVVMPASAPETIDLLVRRGYRVRAADISEFEKAEGGLTCLSVLFKR